MIDVIVVDIMVVPFDLASSAQTSEFHDSRFEVTCSSVNLTQLPQIVNYVDLEATTLFNSAWC